MNGNTEMLCRAVCNYFEEYGSEQEEAEALAALEKLIVESDEIQQLRREVEHLRALLAKRDAAVVEE